MSPENWKKIKAVFNEAVELAPDEWEFVLNAETDAKIAAEVRKLLAAEQKNNFENPVAEVSHLWRETEAEDFIGKQIGNYKITREIGRGGMGVVFEAAREIDGIAQKAALKILRKGISSDALLRRFRHERRILASLEHPNIARLLDGGKDADGEPFFVMEFVDGKPLDEFCNEKELSIGESLRLFLQVCAAVSFAHSRLVVHRDLKPSNILVTDDGAVKLLDFGIAKIVSDEENAPNQTVTALGMMTPEYASPEQIRGEQLTTASDIYSLGLILYELLTGARAYTFQNKRADEMAKVICEAEPVRPSSLVSRPLSFSRFRTFENNGQKTKNDGKKTNPKFLRGDLDNIILKALRKEPARRYASVEQFANDIRRHLEGLPVIARPDTFSYRFEKFVKRNRVSVMAGMLIFITLAGGIALASWQAVRAKRQQALAEQRFNQVRELANNIVFKYYDEAEKLPSSTVIRQMFVDDSLVYFNSLAQDASADDALKGELARTFLRIGRVQGRPSSPNLGNTAGAIENYRRGIELLEPLAEKSADTILRGDLITAYADYAVILQQSGDKNGGEAAFQKAVALADRFIRESSNDETVLMKANSAYIFSSDALPLGAGAGENIAVLDKVIETNEKILQSKPDDLRASNFLVIGCERKGGTLLVLSASAREIGDFETAKMYTDEAGKLFERYVSVSEKLVRRYPDQIIAPALYASANVAQAMYLTEIGEYEKAFADLQKAFDFYNPMLEKGDANIGLQIQVADIEQRFGIALFRLGETEKGEKHFARAFELFEKAIQTDPNNLAFAKQRGETKFNYADELARRGDAAKARQIYDRAYSELFAAAETKDAEYAQSVKANYFEKLGDCFRVENAAQKAAAEYRKAAEIWRENAPYNLSGYVQKDKLYVIEKKINRLQTS